MANFLIKYVITAVAGSIAVYFTVPVIAVPFAPPSSPPLQDQVVFEESDSYQDPTTPPGASIAVKDSSRKPRNAATRKPERTRSKSWGVIRIKTAVYNNNGKFQRTVPPGTIVRDISGSKKSRGRNLCICTLETDSGSSENVLVRSTSILKQKGLISEASETEKQLMVKTGQMLANLAESEKQEKEAWMRKNPHHTEYTETKARSRTFWKKVNQLKKKRDSATGPDHVKYSDLLRSLKGRDIEIGMAHKEAKRKFDEWAKANPFNLSPEYNSSKAAVDKELSRLQQMAKTVNSK